jgi:mannose-1-phosphate guanylyltransferase
MKALLLAAGIGKRLRPITNTIPKCLVPINGRPLMDYWMESLIYSGIKEVLINTHHLHKKVEDYCRKSKFKKNIHLIYEHDLKGTAKTLIDNYEYWKGENSLFIAHADNYLLENLSDFINADKKRPKNCLMTMMTFKTEFPQDCGVVIVDKNGIVNEFYEKVKNPPSKIANGAIYIFSKNALDLIIKKYNNSNDLSIDIIPNFLGKIYTYETKKLLIDIGTIERYASIADKIHNENII